jgi:hypothetical protein
MEGPYSERILTSSRATYRCRRSFLLDLVLAALLSAYSGYLLPLLFSWDGIYSRGSPAWGDYEEN